MNDQLQCDQDGEQDSRPRIWKEFLECGGELEQLVELGNYTEVALNVGKTVLSCERVLSSSLNYLHKKKSLLRLRKILKSTLTGAKDEHNFYAQSVIPFYSSLILCLHGQIGDLYQTSVDIYKSGIAAAPVSDSQCALYLIYEIYLSLGYLSSEIYLDKGESRSIYENYYFLYRKHWLLIPGISTPFVQMSNISFKIGDIISAIYWYMLSAACTIKASDNNLSFLKRKERSNDRNMKDMEDSLLGLISDTITNFGRETTFYIDSLNKSCKYFLESLSKLYSMLESKEHKFKSPKHFLDMFSKIVVSLICTLYYLDDVFANLSQLSDRKKIRLGQTIIVSCIFEVVNHILDTKFLEHSEGVYPIVSLFCLSMTVSEVKINTFSEYVRDNAITSCNLETITRCAKKLSLLIRRISINDLKVTNHLLPEEEIFLSIKNPSTRYMQYDPQILKSYLKNVFYCTDAHRIRIARIAEFLKKLSEKFPDIIIFERSSDTIFFTVCDRFTKEKEAAKLMKALAAERLKGQVNILKGMCEKIKLNVPVAIIAADCYISHLDLVKKWVATKCCIIVVPICVISDLDFIKKQGSNISSRASDAIKYLEQLTRIKSEYIKPLGDAEQYSLCNKNSKIKFNALQKAQRALIMTYMYCKEIVTPVDNSGNVLALISGMPAMHRAIPDFEITIYTPEGWLEYLKKNKPVVTTKSSISTSNPTHFGRTSRGNFDQNNRKSGDKLLQMRKLTKRQNEFATIRQQDLYSNIRSQNERTRSQNSG